MDIGYHSKEAGVILKSKQLRTTLRVQNMTPVFLCNKERKMCIFMEYLYSTIMCLFCNSSENANMVVRVVFIR